jgi:hypothetical protein
VWVIDDGEKIRMDAVDTPFERGEGNPVWRPGQPVRAFAVQNETIALQVVVEAGPTPLAGVTVALRRLDGPGGAAIEYTRIARDRIPDVVGRPIEAFVEHFVRIRRPSGGRTAGESLGWERGAAPPAADWVGPVPDALIPVEAAPAWAAYPLRVEPRTNGIVWIDVNVLPDQPAGTYRGAIEVDAAGAHLASLPVEIEVTGVRLPDRAAGALVYLDADEVARRAGPGAEEHAWKVLRAHRVTPLHDATAPEAVAHAREALDGSLYTRARGYFGPGERAPDRPLCIGAYGGMGDATAENLARVTAVADAAATAIATPAPLDAILYADDEDCESPRGAAWGALLRSSPNANVRRIRVAWTCSKAPLRQPVDVSIGLAIHDAQAARALARSGRELWVYNGVLPRTGAFLIDVDAVSPRVNGWLTAMHDVPEWFYWDATHWYDRHGRAPVDPYEDPESLHNDDGDWANGDGVLLYPGAQHDAFAAHSLGFHGVVASVRLKNWRRGLEDAGYLQLARAKDAARADAVARSLLPAAFDRATERGAPTWSHRGAAFFEARRSLLAIAVGEAPAGPPRPSGPRALPRRYLFAPAAVTVAAAGWAAAGIKRRLGRRRARASGSPRR